MTSPSQRSGTDSGPSPAAERARILFLAWDEPHNASARCRMFDLAEWLADRGWRVEVRSPVGGPWGRGLAGPGPARALRRLVYRSLQLPARWQEVRRAARYDVVILQRELFPFGRPWLESALLDRARKVVFDVDDALHLQPSHFRSAGHRWHDFTKAEAIARRADAVVVSSAVLEEWAAPLARRVVRIPTPVDTDRFRPAGAAQADPDSREAESHEADSHEADSHGTGSLKADSHEANSHGTGSRATDPLVVGWTGTSGNLAHLESIRPALEAAAREVPFVLRIVGESPPEPWRTPRSEFVRWKLEREASEVARFDVGVMPLVDSEYARAKAGYKALVYMACAVPPVVSPVGTNREILEDGAEGFFAETEAEWCDRIVTLLRDGQLRRRLGRAARARVIAERSQQALFPRWEALLNELVEERR